VTEHQRNIVRQLIAGDWDVKLELRACRYQIKIRSPVTDKGWRLLNDELQLHQAVMEAS
jgi:hypothetical protein